MNKDNKGILALFLRDNKENKQNKHKILLERYIQERINYYSKQEKRPDGHIRGMNVLLGDIMELPNEVFNERNNA